MKSSFSSHIIIPQCFMFLRKARFHGVARPEETFFDREWRKEDVALGDCLPPGVGSADANADVQITVEPAPGERKRPLQASDLLRSGLVGIRPGRQGDR